jgi:hypothetical protein
MRRTTRRIRIVVVLAAALSAVGLASLAGTAQALAPLGGVDINNGSMTKTDWERAAKAGAEVGRAQETAANKPSLKEAAKWAFETKTKLDWISFLIVPGETNETSKKTLLQQYEELGANEKSALVLIEHGNEFWPGGAEGMYEIPGELMTEWFVSIAKEFREAKAKVPLGMEIQISPDGRENDWSEEIGKVSHTALKEALEPTTNLPTGNWLVMHPYGAKMTTAETKPNTLVSPTAYAYGGTETDPTPSKEKLWGSQRWMKAQALVKEWTGITVPMALTEYGVRSEYNSMVEEPWWRVPNATAQGEYMEAFWSFIKKVKNGEVTTAPTGLTPVAALAVWYDMYRWNSTESYGIMSGSGVAFEEGSVYKKFKEGMP